LNICIKLVRQVEKNYLKKKLKFGLLVRGFRLFKNLKRTKFRIKKKDFSVFNNIKT